MDLALKSEIPDDQQLLARLATESKRFFAVSTSDDTSQIR
jgi:hypothetical protein